MVPARHQPQKLLHHDREHVEAEPTIDFYNNAITFFNNHPPGKLAKDLYKLIFALMEHQANNQQPVNFASSIYDFKQLLNLLEDVDRLLQNDDPYRQPFFDITAEFMYENNICALCNNLCRITLEFIKYELQLGYPTFINEFLPDVLALLEWLNEGTTLLKFKPNYVE
jgi:hypothetical protein